MGSRRPGLGWKRTRHAGPFEATLDALEPLGASHLDAGCGAGLALQLSAARGATVTGLDASAGLLAFARTRLLNADLRIGEIEELPFAREGFDVVTAFNAIQSAVSPARAVAELPPLPPRVE